MTSPGDDPLDIDAFITSPAGVQKMSDSQELAMHAALLQIDPRMAHGRYMNRVENTCHDIRKGEITGDALVDRVQQRFAGGTIPDFTKQQAQEVIAATIDIWCC